MTVQKKDKRGLKKSLTIDTQVFDGHGISILMIHSSWTHLVLLNKVALIMKVPPTLVTLMYDAPWVKKKGQKMLSWYMTNDDDLSMFWLRYKNHVAEGAKKKKGAEVSCDVTMYNANDLEQVRSLLHAPLGGFLYSFHAAREDAQS